METLQEAISSAIRVKEANKMDFATIWKVGKSFSFNFENKNVGYSITEYGVKRTVLAIV